jgi:hypothetical protein
MNLPDDAVRRSDLTNRNHNDSPPWTVRTERHKQYPSKDAQESPCFGAGAVRVTTKWPVGNYVGRVGLANVLSLGLAILLQFAGEGSLLEYWLIPNKPYRHVRSLAAFIGMQIWP